MNYEADWKKYNKSQKDRRLKMSYEEYVNWMYGKKVKVKSTKTITFERSEITKRATDSIKSLNTNVGTCTKNTMVEKVRTGKIVGPEAEEIISKSQRIAIHYSKGSYQYLTDTQNIQTLGQKR